MWRTFKLYSALFLLFLFLAQPVSAQEVSKIGVHILHPEELEKSSDLLRVSESQDDWHYVTIPFTYQDLERKAQWTRFFARARELRVIPIIRLATEVQGDAWIVPDRKHIVDQLTFLGSVEWPTTERRIIVYNEVNHAKEWGGSIDPTAYADVLTFVASWAHTEPERNFVVLPAALDLAASNGGQTREAFTYFNQLLQADEHLFSYIDAWNSHSYPNPGFSAAPQNTGKNSLRGFTYELAYVKEKTGKDYPVYITETGWETTTRLDRWLPSYYTYAMQHIWSHPQVVAVTPFVLKGAPGPFAGFSFLDGNDQPTSQYHALQTALRQLQASEDQVTLLLSD